MADKYIFKLNAEERSELLILVKNGKGNAKKLMHARVLLAIDEAVEAHTDDDEIGRQLHISKRTIQRIRKAAMESGLDAALDRKHYTCVKRIKKINGEVEANLVMLCCSTPPSGRSKWTMKLLAEHLVKLEIIEEVSATTVQRALKKMNLSLG